MANWHTDMSKAPRGHYVVKSAGQGGKADRRVFEPQLIIAAGKCGVVTVSYYIPEHKRWNMFANGEQPVAWTEYAGQTMVPQPDGTTKRVLDLPQHPLQVAA
ncbi:MAG: hypothetical protein K0R85_160 [Devosia sp.]|jgi:hypothetical protein|nr:hypothetical protein [Devosia sp.]